MITGLPGAWGQARPLICGAGRRACGRGGSLSTELPRGVVGTTTTQHRRRMDGAVVLSRRGAQVREVRYESVHHGVYVEKALRGEDLPRAQAALLAVPGSALALQSAAWLLTRGRVDLPARVELRVPDTRQVRRAGLVAYPGLLEREVSHCRGLRVTSGAQTAVDIACHLRRRPALEAIDALCNTERCTVLEISDLLHRYAGRRGVVRARSLLPEIEPGAESCRETKARLIMIDGGLRRPLANAAVLDAVGGWLAWADLLYHEL